MTNPYIAVQVNKDGSWQWRIECVEGFLPWEGHYATERAAKAAGDEHLRQIWIKSKRFERRLESGAR